MFMDWKAYYCKVSKLIYSFIIQINTVSIKIPDGSFFVEIDKLILKFI